MDRVFAFLADSEEPPETLEAARQLMLRTFEDREECDRLLVRHARHWELSRLAMVDRNVLRLGVYELRQGELSFKIVIAEAIKLAQEFSTAESPRFVNGVLDAIAKEIAAQKE
jgi:N utilization substance protein B